MKWILENYIVYSMPAKDNVYYVYAYLDPRKPGKYAYGSDLFFEFEPFYIGVGKDSRAYDHIHFAITGKKDGNKMKIGKINKIISLNLTPVIVFIYHSNDREVANKYEIHCIKTIGRNDQLNGALSNLTDGGDGCINISNDTKLKISKSLSGRTSCRKGAILSEATKAKISNKLMGRTSIPLTNYQKQCISQAHKGKIVSEETREKQSLSHKGRISWNKGIKGSIPWNKGVQSKRISYLFEFNKERIEIFDLKKYCIENNLVHRNMVSLERGTKYVNSNYRGYSKAN